MHGATQPSEDSYFEADGLAAFAASRADGASTRDSLYSSPHAYEHAQLELHTAPASAVEPERREPSTDDEREGAQGEWDGVAGEYRHGVGYDSTRPPTVPDQLDRRMERLSRRFGPDSAPSAAAERDAAKARFRAAHEAQKREAAELERKTGVSPRTGRLVVLGPKKRNALRWFEGGGAVIVAIGAIGASLFTHPDPPPAPSGSAPLIALCLAPFPSLLLTLYLFVLRPFLYRRRASRAAASPTGVAPGVYPHLMQPQDQGGRGGCCPCFGGGRKRVPRGYGVGSPAAHGFGTLNLVVDPRLLGAGGMGGAEEAERRRRDGRREKRERARRKKRRRERKERRRETRAGGAKDEDDDLVSSSLSDSASSLSSSPSSSTSDAWSSRSPTSSRPNPRHAILSHLSHEATWRSARAALKRETGADALCAVGWGALGVWALEGAGGCAPGEGEGFCQATDERERGERSNLYNTALAFSILVCAAFVGSFTLDCVDLERTKISPRFRQQRLVGVV
ncbi:uncharacterized protein JCM10292_005570 [Rhodotorula paludigena]|uniref:uncharacterized protein n=1 Tax=Rhodotorula paludigena TaxID=86838 RepID=UPI00316D0D77